MFKNKNLNCNGFSLIELLTSIIVMSFMILIIAAFSKKIFSFNKDSGNTLAIYDSSRSILDPIASIIRSTSPSELGGYALETVGDNTFTFYADANNDGKKERIRYFLSGTTLKRGVINPTSNPVNYNGTEIITNIIPNIRNTNGTPIFSYYDTNYNGTNSALTQPVDVSKVRLVKITLILDADPNKQPTAITITTQISLRNLKDNY